jgi:prepilin peptidase CpaA
MLATLLLVTLVLIAAVTDAAQRRIYNWTTYPGMFAGLALASIGATWESISPHSAAAWQPLVGWVALSDALAGFLVCGLMMLVCYVFFHVGGGDLKLLAMVGSLAGLEKGIEILLWTFIFGGCVGLIILIWKLGAFTLIKRAWQIALGVLTLGIFLRPPREEKKVLEWPLFLGPCAAAALAAALVPWPWPH